MSYLEILIQKNREDTYYFNANTYFRITPHLWKKYEFCFISPNINFYAVELRNGTFEIFKDKTKTDYLISFDFSKTFPFFNKNNKNVVIWSAFTIDIPIFVTKRHLTWLKEGKKVVDLTHILAIFKKEKLILRTPILDNELELFASILLLVYCYRSSGAGP